jgi:hypothetical protein
MWNPLLSESPGEEMRGPTQFRPEITLPGFAGYLEVDRVYLNTVLHAAAATCAPIILIGAFASQRHN